jgi:hypothetical protein
MSLIRLLFLISLLSLSVALADGGVLIDPHGGAALDEGSEMDPNGASTDGGPAMDPNGGQACYTACVDPNG